MPRLQGSHGLGPRQCSREASSVSRHHVTGSLQWRVSTFSETTMTPPSSPSCTARWQHYPMKKKRKNWSKQTLGKLCSTHKRTRANKHENTRLVNLNRSWCARACLCVCVCARAQGNHWKYAARSRSVTTFGSSLPKYARARSLGGSTESVRQMSDAR